MFKIVQAIVSIAFLLLPLPGCHFGVVALYPDECENETPTTDARDIEHWEKWRTNPPASVPTKEDFTKAWGEPSLITSSSDKADRETWIYERRLWCGVIPAFLVPIPLLLPVCNGFERIDFAGDRAERIHLRRILLFGVMAFEGIFNDPACRWPLPQDDARIDSEISAATATP